LRRKGKPEKVDELLGMFWGPIVKEPENELDKIKRNRLVCAFDYPPLVNLA
jgi:hypothetical protein